MEPVQAKKAFQFSTDRSKSNEERLKDRVEAVALNKEIAQHASRKQLSEAMVLFERAASLGWANSHTFAAAINANIRCGSVSGAASLFERLRKTKGVKLDVITCTTMLKGFCSEGDIYRSVQLFDEMDKSRPPVVPNIRTINTFLRGCVNTGDIENADKMIIKTQKEYLLLPDVSTWEYHVTLLCQGLLLDKVLPIIGRLKSDVSMAADLGGMNVVIAKASSLLGEWKTCRKALVAARESINLNENQDDADASLALQQYNDVEKDNKNEKSNKNNNINNNNDVEKPNEVETENIISKNMKIEKEATGGKRAWKSPGTGVDEGLDSRAQSLEIFRKHKREELRQEIVLIDEFMERMILLQSPQPIVLKSDAVTVIKKGKGHDVQEEKGDGKGKMKSQGQSEVKGEDTGGKEGSDKSKAGGEKNISKNNKDNKNAVDANVVKEITSSSSSSSSSVEGVNSTEAKNQNQNQGDSSNKKKKKKRKGGAGTDTNEVIVEVSNDNKLLYLLPFYSRLFSFSMPQNHQNEAIIVNTDVTVTTGKSQILPPSRNPKEIVLEELCQAVNSKFGLSVCLQKLNLGASAVSASSTCDENNFNGSSSKRMKSEENVLDNEESSSTEKVTETSNSKALEIDEEDKVNVGEENGKKTLSRKEKRNESNINKKNKNKKKKAATTTIEKKIEKIETLNEILFKNIMSENILSNGFINFNSVFEKKIFIKEIKNEIQNENTNISHINNSTEDKKVDEISQIEINKSTIVPITVPILKLEICSGAGEWAISQATNDKSSNWVTMELRHDRVYQTFTRSIYAGVDNLCVIGGDATRILPTRIQTGSMDFIFINHPEPPQQTGGFDSQGKHMLTLDLFGELARVVKTNGMITIVTDNLWYGKFLMRMIANQGQPNFIISITPKKLLEKSGRKEKKDTKSDRGGKSSKTSNQKNMKNGKITEEKVSNEVVIGGPGEWTVLEEEGGVSLYVGKPGSECGVAVDASSYFDRLWKRDQKVERYFLVLEKGPGTYSAEDHGNNLKIVHQKSMVKQELRISTSASLEERAKRGGYAEKAMKAAAFLQSGGSNKKIKFEE